MATGRAERDPTGDLQGALPPTKGTNFAAVIEDTLRPGELRTMQWAHIDFEAGEWRYRVTKTDTEHIVPLARQALVVLHDLHPLT